MLSVDCAIDIFADVSFPFRWLRFQPTLKRFSLVFAASILLAIEPAVFFSLILRRFLSAPPPPFSLFDKQFSLADIFAAVLIRHFAATPPLSLTLSLPPYYFHALMIRFLYIIFHRYR
jgi:hypothetical protein